MQIWLQVRTGILNWFTHLFWQSLLPQRTGHATKANPPRPILFSSAAQLDWQVGLVGAAIDGVARLHIVATPKSAASANDLRILHRLVIFPPLWLLVQKGLAPLDRLTLC